MTQLLNIDCKEYMKTLPDKSFDLAVVDVPYGIGEHGGKVRFGGQSEKKGFKTHKHYDKKNWDNEPPDEEYFTELFRVSKNQIIWGANHFISKIPYDSPCWIVWDKKGNDKADFADCELAWTSFKTAVRKFKYDWVGFGYINNPHKEKKIHPTQKPKALYKWIYENYAQHGWKILDTHLGSFSSAIVAEKMGFDFAGCEADIDYFRDGLQRFKDETDLGLFKNCA